MGICSSLCKEKKVQLKKHQNLEVLNEVLSLNQVEFNSFMKSILQCLSYTKSLTNHLLNKYGKYNYYNKKISDQYYNLLRNLWKEKNTSYFYSINELDNCLESTNFLLEKNQINEGKEFLNYLFTNIHNELNKPNNNNNGNNMENKNPSVNLSRQLSFQNFFNNFKNNYNSIISNLFYGINELRFKCVNCKKMNYKYEVFHFLEFSLKEIASDFKYNKTFVKIKGLRFPNKNPIIDLNKCFEYNNTEKLLTTKDFKCFNCNNDQHFNFSTSTYSMPNYLVIITINEKDNDITYKVDYPEKIDLGGYIIQNKFASTFNLYAIIEKIKIDNSYKYEYNVYCRNLDNNNIWYKYDNKDNKVIEYQNIKNEKINPYFLFYKDNEINEI